MRGLSYPLLCGSALLGAGVGAIQARDDTDFDWASIKPSRSLEYHKCYGSYKCARLEVPLDWTHCNDDSSKCGKDTQWATIAIATLPANVSETDASFGGTVLINPGGPGGSGVEFALSDGQYLQQVVDGEKHYEILGFDPRGIMYSTPTADCYKNDFARGNDDVMRGGLPSTDWNNTQDLDLYYGISKGFSDLCAKPGSDSIFKYMSTASVARDMLEIADQVAAAREKTTKKRSAEPAKLQYLGLSYGTFIGNTFASMFPDRVGRMVLDGVVNANNYIEHEMSVTLQDAEKVVYHFYETCFKAGSDCVLKAKSDRSAADIKKRVDKLIAELQETPTVTVYQDRTRLVTSHLIQDSLRQMLYQPVQQYEAGSIILAEALAGNYSALMQSPSSTAQTVEESDVCVKASSKYPLSEFALSGSDAIYGVFCGDTYTEPSKRDLSWARAQAKHFQKQSPTVGESWTRIALGCAGWRFKPKFAYRGPFGSPKSSNGSSSSSGGAPLLLLSNRYDHATPLVSAYKTSSHFKGSAVVVQESWGHTALLTSRSKCTKDHVSKYFATGALPKNGTTCEQDCVPSIPYKECPGLPASS